VDYVIVNICRGFGVLLGVWILSVSASMVLAQTPDKLNAKSLEAVASYAQSLAQWAFIIIGGSLVLVLGTSHRWPKSRWLRASYFVFPLAWGSLARSIYFGTRVQDGYLAYFVIPSVTLQSTVGTVNADLRSQIHWMFIGLGLFCIWLMVYLSWSILSKETPNAKETPDA
jgi:hypothetical protein